MCGLVGMAGKINMFDKDMFKYMLWFDAIKRGMHGTGIIAAEYSKERYNVNSVKIVGPPDNLFQAENKIINEDGRLKGIDLCAVLGHNRKATSGVINTSNAHPFNFSGLMGMHNGTLPDWAIRDLPGYKDFEVDSAVLYNNINEKGPDVLNEVDGAMALTWYDTEKNEVYLYHNKQRPLYIAKHKVRDVIYWASEPWMIEMAARLEKEAIEACESLPINKLFKITFDGRNPTLVEGDTYEKKWTQVHAGTNTGTTVGNTGIRQGFINNQIFQPIAKNWKKGTKSVSGKKQHLTLKLVGYEKHTNNSSFFRARVLNDSKYTDYVEIICNDVGINALQHRMRAGKPYVNIKKGLRKVQRQNNLYRAHYNNIQFIETQLKNVEIPASIDTTKDEKVLNDRSFEIILRKNNWECISCGNPLSVEDKSEVEVVNGHCLCAVCKEDDYVYNLIQFQ